MGVFLAVLKAAVAVPVDGVRWAWNLLQVGRLRVQLETERQQLASLRELRARQRQELGQYLMLRLEGVRLHLQVPEPYVEVVFAVFNGSVFEVKLTHWIFTAARNSNHLSLAPTLVGRLPELWPGRWGRVTIHQPVSKDTAGLILTTIEKHDRHVWHFTPVFDYVVPEISQTGHIGGGEVQRLEIPWEDQT